VLPAPQSKPYLFLPLCCNRFPVLLGFFDFYYRNSPSSHSRLPFFFELYQRKILALQKIETLPRSQICLFLSPIPPEFSTFRISEDLPRDDKYLNLCVLFPDPIPSLLEISASEVCVVYFLIGTRSHKPPSSVHPSLWTLPHP